MAIGWTFPGRQGYAGGAGRSTAPRFVGRDSRVSPVFDDDPRTIPADLVGSVGHMLDDAAREAFRSGPASAEEELAYAQAVAPGAHTVAAPAPAPVQEVFRRRRSFDARRFFLAPDGNLYARGDTPAENPGWTLRRQMRGLSGASDDPTLDELMQRYFRFASDEVGATPVGEQHAAPAGGQQTQPVPQLLMENERRRSILDDTPSEFPVAPNPDADSGVPSYAIPEEGTKAVQKYDELIVEEARRIGVDPDLVRAVMYVENSQGWYGPFFESLGISDSLLPMNVKPRLWGSLAPGGENLRDPKSNIAAGIQLLRRIADRVPDGDIAKIATLYNGLSKEVVQDFGARVLKVYRSKPWLDPDPRSFVEPLPELNVP
jgi:hypothetical protein